MITVPGWNMDDDFRSFHNLLPTANQRKSMRPDNELVELVWQNGNVVLHSQTRETTGSVNEHRETNKHDAPSKNGGLLERNPNNFNQQDVTASWMQYPLDDSLTKDFCSDFFYGMPISESIGMDKLGKDNIPGDRCIKFGFNEDTNVFTNSLPKQSSGLHIEENTMPPPNSQTIGSTMPQASSAETSGFVNFSHFTTPVKIDTEMYQHPNEKDTGNVIQRKVGEPSSMVSKLSGNWGSNQIQKQPDLGHSLSSGVLSAFPKQEGDVQKKIRKRGQTETHDTTTVTSSSGGSGSSVGRTGQQITSSRSHKRKGRHVEESESHSEEAENQSHEVGRSPQRSTSTRRSRAAEVHNQSERKRRDRINEKMKALQELIPHCNKTDKASMLDEAIEYLKSLQLQVQIMWMGSGMAPMVFPNPQQYMSLMGRAMGQGSIPSIPGSSQMPSVPVPNQSVPSVATTSQEATGPSQILKSVDFPNQMQNSNIPDAYVRYLGFLNMQPPSQPNQTTLTGSNDTPNGNNPSENIQSGKSG